ncbi:hypothetical protein [Limnoraphis robusta]|uniref:Uncharacterized protein n=1 Tax=Limnoraphis robusta CS-951 TaxID=1637645 RepID=A0A0F5Y914_9CYAN|nr:hypothetical protein [Limnoraphis robusta]KKD35248.1 hypothetical protein WN50_26355 [Limnoraphis robusta CS-951]
MYHNYNAALETIQAVNDLLKTVTEASSQLGANSVLDILKFSGVCETSKTQQPASKAIAETLEQGRKAIMLVQIEKAGIELTPRLKSLINNSDFPNVQEAIKRYETFYSNRQVGNPAGLFYTILNNLNNENQGSAASA